MIPNEHGKPVVDHDPNAIMRPKPMTKTRRLVCLCAGVAFIAAALWFLSMAAGQKPFLMAAMALFTLFFAAILIWTALFPNFTLAREKLDRRRNR